MSQIIQNGSHLKKLVTLVETSNVQKKMLDLLKWVRFEEMCHTTKKVMFLKKGSTLRN